MPKKKRRSVFNRVPYTHDEKKTKPKSVSYLYLVIRVRKYLLYVEYLGPIWSTCWEIAGDAERTYGKKDHTLSWKPWSEANWRERELTNQGRV